MNQKRSFPALLPEPSGLFGFIAFWVLCALSGSKSLLCADTLWHIKVGQVILQTGQILKHDIFSHTVPDKAWVSHEWLAEVVMAYTYNISGLAGVNFLYFLLVSLTVIFLFNVSLYLSDEWSAIAAIAIAFSLSNTHLLARPHIFSWFFGALFLLIIIKNKELIWTLPILTIVWCNLHAGVFFGLIIQGAFLFEVLFKNLKKSNFKKWSLAFYDNKNQIVVFLLSIAALLVNPSGYELLFFPFKVSSSVFTQSIGEWQSPNLQEMWYVRLWLILLATLLLKLGNKTKWAWKLMLAFFVFEALGYQRHLSIAALFLAPWTAMGIKEFGFQKSQKKHAQNHLRLSPYTGPILLLCSFTLLFVLSIYKPASWEKIEESFFPLPERYSNEVLSYLETHGYPGQKLFNEYTWGGYLLFSLSSPPKLFIDGRADMYGEEVFSDYLKIKGIHSELDETLKNYEIDWILFPTDSQLIRFLKNTQKWTEIYSDDQATILALNATLQLDDN